MHKRNTSKTELLLSVLVEQGDRELQKEERQKFVGETAHTPLPPPVPPSFPPSLLHAPLGLLAALQNCARGHSGNHLFPARGTQEARLTNLRGKMVVCQYVIVKYPPPQTNPHHHLTPCWYQEKQNININNLPTPYAVVETHQFTLWKDVTMRGLINWPWYSLGSLLSSGAGAQQVFRQVCRFGPHNLNVLFECFGFGLRVTVGVWH